MLTFKVMFSYNTHVSVFNYEVDINCFKLFFKMKKIL